MMKILTFFLVFLFLGCSSSNLDSKIVYIDNIKVFESFEMKKDYDKKIENEVKGDREELDNLIDLLNSTKDELELIKLKKVFVEKKQLFESNFQDLAKTYTNMVNSRLNEYLKKYANTHNISFILGGTGQGNVMYVNDQSDITDKVIEFINHSYNE